VNPSDSHIRDQRHIATKRPRRDHRLLGDGQITRTGREDDDASHWRRQFAAGQPEGTRQPILLRLGEVLGEIVGLLGGDARRQAVLSRFGQLAHDAADPFARLPLAENHLREAATLAAVQIDVGITQLGDRRHELPRRRVDIHLAGLYRFEQRTQFSRVHVTIL
jgi:hypothetical protein